jgi:hypothetical protein
MPGLSSTSSPSAGCTIAFSRPVALSKLGSSGAEAVLSGLVMLLCAGCRCAYSITMLIETRNVALLSRQWPGQATMMMTPPCASSYDLGPPRSLVLLTCFLPAGCIQSQCMCWTGRRPWKRQESIIATTATSSRHGIRSLFCVNAVTTTTTTTS